MDSFSGDIQWKNNIGTQKRVQIIIFLLKGCILMLTLLFNRSRSGHDRWSRSKRRSIKILTKHCSKCLVEIQFLQILTDLDWSRSVEIGSPFCNLTWYFSFVSKWIYFYLLVFKCISISIITIIEARLHILSSSLSFNHRPVQAHPDTLCGDQVKASGTPESGGMGEMFKNVFKHV